MVNEKTPNLQLPYLYSNQSQKEVTVNTSLATLDAILNNGVVTQTLATPPSSPDINALYIVAASATDEWTGKEDHLAYYNNGWKFIEPNEGFTIWVNDEDLIYSFDGSGWISTLAAPPTTFTTLGVNATADATNKLAVASSAILFDNVGAGVQAKINKLTATDTNSLLFQTGYSGRAEMGCAGDDNFHFKVSPDGSTWVDAIQVDKTSGDVTVDALTASRALVTDSGKKLTSSSVTSTELGYVSGVTSAIQTQINGKQASDATLTALAAYNTNGLLTQTAADTFTGRTITGTTNRITLTNGDGVSGNPTIDISSSYVGQNTITTLGTITTGTWNGAKLSEVYGGTNQNSYTTGDILYASATNTLSKLAAGTNGYVLTLAAGVPTWAASSGGGTVTSVATGSTLTGGTITTTGTLDINLANANTWTKAQRGAFVTLTDASTIAVDASLSNNFFVVLGGNRTLGTPTNLVAGQTGVISVYQDITGSRTLAYSWAWQFPGGTAPTLSTAKLTFDQLIYCVNKYATATVTMTIASPCVVTWTAHGLSSGDRVQLTTTGALPTGLSASTTYWVTVVDANSFKLSSSLANAQAATFINTSGSQSGTHTATNISITVANNLAIA